MARKKVAKKQVKKVKPVLTPTMFMDHDAKTIIFKWNCQA